jgi:glutamate synthase (NADPH/NADH) small chain
MPPAAPSALFEEARPPLDGSQAQAEAERCLQCGGPEAQAPCTVACPADVDISAFITALARGDRDGAAAIVFAANLLSGTCSRVCPVEVLCESTCVLEREGRRPVQIGRLHRYAADWGLERPRRWRPEAAPRGHRVAVIGAGPAGIVCAAELAARGFRVTLYDAREEPGGLVRFAIAPYRQVREPLPAEVRLAQELGVELRLGSPIDSAQALAAIEAQADAIFLSVGLGADTDADLPGEDLPGVWRSLEFIEQVKSGSPPEIGRRVAVIGGGNTAVDVARIAVRMGASDVSLVYRRSEAEMPAYPHEVDEARAEGVRFEWLTEPLGFLGGRRLEAVHCRRTRLGLPDARGRRRPEPLPGTEFLLPTDSAVKAIGQQPRRDLLSWIDGLTPINGRVEVDPATTQTANPKYFAGGDVVNGGATVVEAVRWGKLAARGIERALEA